MWRRTAVMAWKEFVQIVRDYFQDAPVLIASVVAGAQLSGMLAALIGGAVTGWLSSKWAVVLGLALSAVSVLAFFVLHTYLVTTGPSLGEHLRSMVTGFRSAPAADSSSTNTTRSAAYGSRTPATTGGK